MPLQLFHSWPLSEQERRFDLGAILDPKLAGTSGLSGELELALQGVGRWECNLADNALTWSAAVYDIFGFPRGVEVSRREALAIYSEESRSAMERLRAHAIEHRRGFTLDALVIPGHGRQRWMRLIAMPVCEGDRVTRLQGIKRML